MGPKKPPGDETIKGMPAFPNRAEDSFVGASRAIMSELKKAAEAAPEVSQGAWRERVFTPRAIMSREEVKAGLESALRITLASANGPRVAFEKLRPLWYPLLRQALEQAGGDGIDAWLGALFTPPPKTGKQPLFASMAEGLTRLRAALELAGFEEAALKLMALVDDALGAAPVKLSFKQMERQLEGKLEVDELLAVRAGPDEELHRRMGEIGGTMEKLREEIRKLPGRQPDGMYANFVRLKAELRVIDAELKRRRSAP